MSREVALRRGDEEPRPSDVELVDARGPGYGMSSSTGDAACALAMRHAGLVLDPAYTAKALSVLPVVVPDGPALFWHTGGLLDAVAALMGPQ